jgi:NAD(P)-dependent dehydrogenase (short-subunit alcohol dehydrogenase family)
MTERSLAGMVCVVTGGTRGIGLATAGRLAAAGGIVVVAARDAEACGRVAEDLCRQGAEATGIAVDLTDEDSVAALYAAAVAEYGRLDVCVDNAGSLDPGDAAPIQTSLETWRRVIEVNLTGTFACVKHQLPHLIESGGGSIVIVSGMVATLGSATPQVAYDAAKAGQLALTRDVAVTHAADRIRCNAVAPGPIEGPMISSLVADEAAYAARLQHIPGGRFGRAEEVAEAIAYLAGPASSWTTGAVIPVDGGATIAYNTAAS